MNDYRVEHLKKFPIDGLLMEVEPTVNGAVHEEMILTFSLPQGGQTRIRISGNCYGTLEVDQV